MKCQNNLLFLGKLAIIDAKTTSLLTTFKQLIPLQQSNKVTQNTPPPPPSSRQGVIDHLESQVNLNEYLAQIQKGVVQAYQGKTYNFCICLAT